MERERVMEMLIALIFIVLIFIMILIGLSVSNTTTSTISNSYNHIDNSKTITHETAQTVKVVKKPVQTTHHTYRDYDKKHSKTYSKYDKKHSYISKKMNYYYSPRGKHFWDWGENYYYKDYDSYGWHIKEDKKLYYADTYKVYVYNDGPGQYITVRFYFEDYWGYEKTHDMRKYVGFDEEELFYFRDVSKYKDEYYNWRYKILD